MKKEIHEQKDRQTETVERERGRQLARYMDNVQIS